MARVGILGGTFNPPHLGHLVIAQEAHDQLDLDRVVLMPVHTPPHKELHADPGPGVRAQLCRLAVEGDERLRVSTREIEQEGPSYTVQTLRAIAAEQPEDELVFIVGGDMALSLPTWKEPEAILALATLAVAAREGTGRDDIITRVAGLDGAQDRVRFFQTPRLDISSSDVRRRVGAGRPVRYLVPPAVAEYLGAHGLYRLR
ncbi:MAG: nicotinate (nicotinamide) nucleotide adenylyltransferase [Solirubrobacterales bacterium]|jgi:nicotinate-nucleotide adenylyltransferase|nr:nicotinate (nicotinamide) nucleotide adenylyltransferase [Solirubrobacterales bacterium]